MVYHNEISIWAYDLYSIKDYTPVKVWNLLQFYKPEGKKTVLSKENMVPIKDVRYTIFSATENKYYIKKFRNYNVDTLYFYRKNYDFYGEDAAVESLRNYVYDQNVHLLLNNEQMEEINTFLQRLWKTRFTGDAKVKYRLYINLLDQSLKLEDYRTYSTNLMGRKTVINQMEIRINSIWEEIYNYTLR